jgi:hypothetical protein
VVLAISEASCLPEQFWQLRRLLEARMSARGKREFIQVLRLMETFDQNLVADAVKDARCLRWFATIFIQNV